MTDLALDLDKDSATYQDLQLVNGDLVLTGDGATAILQDVLTALRMFYGEWFLNLAEGVDYYGTILVKNPDQGKINAAFIAEIRNVPGVTSINTYSFKTAFTSRKLSIKFSLQTTAGKVDYTGTL